MQFYQFPPPVYVLFPDKEAITALSSHQFRTLVCLYQSVACTVHTHQQITLLLATSTGWCWMFPTAQLTLSTTPSHTKFDKLSADRRWLNMKHSKAGLQTSSYPQALVSHLFGLQVPRQIPALSLPFHCISSTLRYLQ